MMDFGALMQMQQMWAEFTANHPKVPAFLSNVGSKGCCEGQEIAVAIRYPDGTEYKTGIRVRESDLRMLNTIGSLMGKQ